MYPVLFKCGPIHIYSYGVMLALAFLLATFLARRRAISIGMDGDTILDLGVYLIVSGILGARLLYVLLNLEYYKDNPFESLTIWRGGLAWYGGFTLAILVAIWFSRAKVLPLLKTCDLIIPYVALGQAIGRIGCFLNGCCYGKPTTLAIGVRFGPAQAPVHPTQLYESAAMFLVYLILRGRRPGDGKTFFLYLIFYSTFRFFVEFLRGDNPQVFMGLTVFQIISIIVLATAIILWKNLLLR
ncbi:MAG: hypothetical protein AMJ78_07535 [Omnitrophica WOR_2 bacterium SM23_29]|nr:MAG: hypothetical protein AMJ78_07535 [Omnitrophica WOR_2 bacterium SM23_29]